MTTSIWFFMMLRWLLRTKDRMENELKERCLIWQHLYDFNDRTLSVENKRPEGGGIKTKHLGFPVAAFQSENRIYVVNWWYFFIENPSFLIICCWFLWFAGEESRNRVKDVFAPSFDFHLPNQWSQCTKCNGDQPGKLRWGEKTTRYDINQDRDGDSIVFAENHHSNLYKRNHFTRLLKSPSLQQTALLMSMSRGSSSCTGYTQS